MIKASLFRNSLFYTIGNILPQLTGFVLLPVYANFMEPSEYGVVNAMTVLSGVLSILLTLGVERGIYRLYYDYNEESRKEYLGTIFIGLVGFTLLFTILIFLFPHSISWVFNGISFSPYYSLMLLILIVTRLNSIPSIYLRVTEQAGVYIILSSLNLFLNIGFNLYLVVALNEGAIGMLKASFLSNLLVAPVYLYFLKGSIKVRFNSQYFHHSIRFSLPLLPSMIFAWILNLSDRVFIERFLSLNEVGVYSFGYKIASVLTVLAGGIFNAYNPRFYNLANSKIENSKAKIVEYNEIIIKLLLLMTFLLAVFMNDVFYFLVPDKYGTSLYIIPILLLGMLFSQITGLYNLMIYQEKRSMQLMYITAFAAFVNIISNLIFIPSLGLQGAAIATAVSYLSILIVEYQYAKKCFFVPLNINNLFRLVVTIISVGTILVVLLPQGYFLSILIKMGVSAYLVFHLLLKSSSLFDELLGHIWRF